MEKKVVEDDTSGQKETTYETEVLETEDFEDEQEEQEPRKKPRWKKVAAILLVSIVVIICGVAISFFVLRASGEKSLKTKVSEPEKESGTESASKKDGHYILYNGKEYRYREDVINILCMGIDKDIPMEQKRETGSMGLVDAILLVSLDTKAHTMKLIAIPRDTMADIRIMDKAGNPVGVERKQLTYQYAYGYTARQSCELTVEAVSKILYQVPIQRYCSLNFQAIPTMNDAIGGVDVTVLEDMTWYDWRYSQGNVVHLEGYMALDYVRQRDEYVTGSNIGRIERQKQYMSAFLEKAKTVIQGDLTIPITLFQQLQGNMSTDVQVDDITYLVPEVLQMSLAPEDMSMLPGDVVVGEQYEEYHLQEEAVKEMVIQTFYEEVTDEEN